MHLSPHAASAREDQPRTSVPLGRMGTGGSKHLGGTAKEESKGVVRLGDVH
jgi:hypothetical protein